MMFSVSAVQLHFPVYQAKTGFTQNLLCLFFVCLVGPTHFCTPPPPPLSSAGDTFKNAPVTDLIGGCPKCGEIPPQAKQLTVCIFFKSYLLLVQDTTRPTTLNFKSDLQMSLQQGEVARFVKGWSCVFCLRTTSLFPPADVSPCRFYMCSGANCGTKGKED